METVLLNPLTVKILKKKLSKLYWLHISSRVLLVFPSLELRISCDLWDLLEGPIGCYTWDKGQFYCERVDKRYRSHSIQNKEETLAGGYACYSSMCCHTIRSPLWVNSSHIHIYTLTKELGLHFFVLGLENLLFRHLLDFYYTKVSTYSHLSISRIQEIIFLFAAKWMRLEA